MGYLPDQHGLFLLSGKKSEVVLLDSLGANTALDIARQILGRVPGMNVSETENAGFPANGIAVRGLSRHTASPAWRSCAVRASRWCNSLNRR